VIYKKVLPKKVYKFFKVIRSLYMASKVRILRRLLYFSLRQIPSIYSFLTLSNETGANKDGTGAQLQRMLAVASLSETLGTPFLQNKIIDVAIHPLDPFQERIAYESYLSRLNDLFQVHIARNPRATKKSVSIRNLRFRNLLKNALISWATKTPTLLVIENPYAVSDLNVDAYKLVRSKLEVMRVIQAMEIPRPYIAIHYRQGVGGFVTYPGQSVTREMNIEYFKEEIHKFLGRSYFDDPVVHIFTDAPSVKMQYEPPASQQYLWDGSPGYKAGVMQIQPLVFDAEKLGVRKVEIHSGGDPLDAIIMMASASLLILGRSSLSYVAGLLNEKGVIIPAPLFWHPPLSGWSRN
jgi:hypothetical protein